MREATRGCRVVLLVATDIEAAPLSDPLPCLREIQIATKVVSVRELRQMREIAGAAERPSLRMALAVSGCDKANAALTLTALLQAMSPAPELVLQVGIAGGFASSGARPGDLVLATQEAYADTGASSPTGWQSARNSACP